MAEELFRGADLLVRRVGGHRSACCVVTFDSFTDFRTLDRVGFAEHFLNSHGIDAIHVIARDNDWYQYADVADAMATVRAATRGYARVVTYGSSMGAYAAIRLAGLAGAGVVLALSPQYSIDPAVVPWEDRWIESSALFRGVWEATLAFPRPAEAYVVYDPADPDRRHTALLARRLKLTRVALRGAGHPVTGFLAEVGLLKELILTVCRGPLDPAAFVKAARARRHLSGQHFLTRAKHTWPWRHARRIALTRAAVRLSPHNPVMVSRLGIMLARAGRFEEALAMHRRALDLAPDHPNLLFHQSVTLEYAGDIGGALAAMERARELADGTAIYQPRIAALRALAARLGAHAAPRRADGLARMLGWPRWRAAKKPV